MQEFTEMGHITYRTKLMSLPRAAAFARALNANARFDEVEIVASKRTQRDDRWIVRFTPSNPARVDAMLQGQQDARAERAASQRFEFVIDPSGAYLHCYSHHSGETYELDLEARTCNCPDSEIRLRNTGVRCKHQIAAQGALAAGQIGEFVCIPKCRPIGLDMEWVKDQAAFEQVFG